MEHLLYGAAYYYEYLPKDRLQEDITMMKEAGINVVRIAESTWSTYEKQEGVFDFSTVIKVMDAMEEAGISVIIGTPTYAVPAWMVRSHPEVLAFTERGTGVYGARQIMDITSPVYRFYAERIIRKLMEVTAHRKCVIGYQLDNETKYYGTAGRNVQMAFIKYLKEKFGNDLEAMNYEFGLDYWSNRIDAWEDFPDVRGTINGSLGAEFNKFRRTLVDEFLSWQAGIVSEYIGEDQFLTQNFDYEWRGHSYGVQPMVNHFHASKAVTIAGTDIYHPTQEDLTGEQIAFGGDMSRSLKRGNYLVLETQAQGFPGWTPYRGQLRLQAYSHIASGAESVMYWHWHSIHNSFETYWKGLLSHDFAENDTYMEAKQIGSEFHRLSPKLIHMKKKNRVAILVSNEALTALEWFPINNDASGQGKTGYNDIVRAVYDQLYRMNVECDFLFPDSEFTAPGTKETDATDSIPSYDLIVVPALYAAPEGLLYRLKDYTEQGGHLFMTFKSAFTDENVKVYADKQPHILHECFGMSYNQFTFPQNVSLNFEQFTVSEQENQARLFMELLKPEGAEVLASYRHDAWKEYAAVTRNSYGRGVATYLGCMTTDALLREILADTVKTAGLWQPVNEIGFPVIVRKGRNQDGKELYFYLNYSGKTVQAPHAGEAGSDLLSGAVVLPEQIINIAPWDLSLICQN